MSPVAFASNMVVLCGAVVLSALCLGCDRGGGDGGGGPTCAMAIEHIYSVDCALRNDSGGQATTEEATEECDRKRQEHTVAGCSRAYSSLLTCYTTIEQGDCGSCQSAYEDLLVCLGGDGTATCDTAMTHLHEMGCEMRDAQDQPLPVAGMVESCNEMRAAAEGDDCVAEYDAMLECYEGTEQNGCSCPDREEAYFNCRYGPPCPDREGNSCCRPSNPCEVDTDDICQYCECNLCLASECAQQSEACAANAQCGSLFQCVAACDSGDTACFSTCEETNPEGVAPLTAFLSCYDERCGEACGQSEG